MATISTALPGTLIRPRPDADHRSKSGHRVLGLVLGVIGVGLATIALIANIVAGSTADAAARASVLAWSSGLTTTAFAVIKVGIAVILIGILVRLWLRIDSVRATLPRLKADADPGAVAAAVTQGDVVTAFGRAQGLQFLGQAMLLGGISFLLGSILAGLRSGGSQVQAGLAVPVTTLRMPLTAKLFVGLMMAGMLVSIAQFVVYLWVATQTEAVVVAANLAWLGPFRELGLGLLLAGIVLALATIARVLGFQFWRIRQIIETGS